MVQKGDAVAFRRNANVSEEGIPRRLNEYVPNGILDTAFALSVLAQARVGPQAMIHREILAVRRPISPLHTFQQVPGDAAQDGHSGERADQRVCLEIADDGQLTLAGHAKKTRVRS